MSNTRWWAQVSCVAAVLFANSASAAGKKSAGGSGGHPVVRLAAEAFSGNAKDIALLAVANPLDRESSEGSAALVRLDDGRDGGLPTCYLLELQGKPYSPGRIAAQQRMSVCPAGAPKGAQLSRVALSGRHEAWQVRLESARYDSKAGGGETAAFWGLFARQGGDLRSLWERTSTTFKSKGDVALNQSEVCGAPQIVAGSQEPDSVTVVCDTETMAGKLPKRARLTFKSSWAGDRYIQN
ncbi:MAG: hypothetical protein FJ100_01490 [Deltaproteobacteria bacterium]|nr:hypothetical protein [Deltaproteobacteria bacterium]